MTSRVRPQRAPVAPTKRGRPSSPHAAGGAIDQLQVPTGRQVELLELQRQAGNRAVSQRLQAAPVGGTDAPPTLAVAGSHDRSEQEANRVAAAMVPERLTTAPAAPAVREPPPALVPPTRSAEAPAEVEHAVLALGAGRPVPAVARAAAESQLGRNLGEVRVHVGATASTAAAALGAQALTIGRNIVFGAGRYAPETDKGRHLLAHELTHVMQQAKAGPVAAPTIQRQAQTPLEEVQAVSSLHVEESLQGAVSGEEGALRRKLVARQKAITKALQQVKDPKIRDQPWAKKKAEMLERDLAKSQDDVLKTPDSASVDKALRADIVKAHKALVASSAALTEGEKRWHRYDDIFASAAVVKTLAAKGFSPADLKALVAQESMDLLVNETKGDIAGIAQMGAKEAKEAGGAPADRLDAKKAIPLSAKVLVLKARQLDAVMATKPSGNDYKKFVFASYNAGASTIATAQHKAAEMKRNSTSWDQLVAGGDKSPLFAAIKDRLPKSPTRKKYNETTDYVERIFKRLR